MHNRARLVVGSFLTKDLGIDWRWGERWFMRWLIDGDAANNNGNWQWIASVGVDPQPFYRRMYNPARHQERFDPRGDYVRRYVPELRRCRTTTSRSRGPCRTSVQRDCGCVIGRDYPEPIVDRRAARRERTSATALVGREHHVGGLDHRGHLGALRDPELLDRLGRDRGDRSVCRRRPLDVRDRLTAADAPERSR